ncbi:hypothetical protein WJX72_009953 [[Myrmecia] bisecta]|uniref:Glycosyltransferase n=1 Tax=[Myrmecia] bisecta TaxID=41462 RepID=A0AAW1P133_9CHLO
MKLTLLLLVSVILQGYSAAADRLHSRSIRSAEPQPAAGADPMRVAILNRVGYHNEVYTALLQAFSLQGADVTVFSDTNPVAALGIESVIRSWYTKPFRHYEELLPVVCDYSVLVFATWPEVHVPFAEQVVARNCAGQQFLFTVHNPEELETPANLAGLTLAAKVNAQFVALAPHTTAATAAVLQRHNINQPTALFVPIFNVDSAQSSAQESAQGSDTVGAAVAADWDPTSAVAAADPRRNLMEQALTALAALPAKGSQPRSRSLLQATDASNPRAGSAAPRKGFAVQGLFQSHRRNYAQTFEEIAESPELAGNPDFVLHVIGQGNVDVPASLEHRIIIDTALPYKEYYASIRGCLAVLPAFASNMYYTKKASSSVAAAVVCKTPLIADEQLLKSYTYLTEASVYLKTPGETDAACMARVMKMSPEDIASRQAALDAVTQAIYADNAKVVADVLQRAHHVHAVLNQAHHLH